jgi:hypothetical protein
VGEVGQGVHTHLHGPDHLDDEAAAGGVRLPGLHKAAHKVVQLLGGGPPKQAPDEHVVDAFLLRRIRLSGVTPPSHRPPVVTSYSRPWFSRQSVRGRQHADTVT